MALAMRSQFAKAWDEGCLRWCPKGLLAVSCAALWLWLPICYVGMLIAPAAFCGIVLQALCCASSVFWGVVIVALTFLGRGAYRSWQSLVDGWHARILTLEVLFAFAGFILGALFIAYTVATGFYLHP